MLLPSLVFPNSFGYISVKNIYTEVFCPWACQAFQECQWEWRLYCEAWVKKILNIKFKQYIQGTKHVPKCRYKVSLMCANLSVKSSVYRLNCVVILSIFLTADIRPYNNHTSQSYDLIFMISWVSRPDKFLKPYIPIYFSSSPLTYRHSDIWNTFWNPYLNLS